MPPSPDAAPDAELARAPTSRRLPGLGAGAAVREEGLRGRRQGRRVRRRRRLAALPAAHARWRSCTAPHVMRRDDVMTPSRLISSHLASSRLIVMARARTCREHVMAEAAFARASTRRRYCPRRRVRPRRPQPAPMQTISTPQRTDSLREARRRALSLSARGGGPPPAPRRRRGASPPDGRRGGEEGGGSAVTPPPPPRRPVHDRGAGSREWGARQRAAC